MDRLIQSAKEFAFRHRSTRSSLYELIPPNTTRVYCMSRDANGEPLQLSLRTVPLSQHPDFASQRVEYYAISYVWEEARERSLVSIKIRDKLPGKKH
jgi:hypothetical protein